MRDRGDGRSELSATPRGAVLWLAATVSFTGCADAVRDADGDDAGRSDVDIVLEDFAGSDACRGCHTAQYAAWVSSTHGRAEGHPGPENVIAPFDGTPIAFSDATVTPLVDSAGRYLFLVRESGSPDRSFAVDGVIGGGHMLGGGTQGFVTRVADGTVRFLPFDYSRQLDAWFCNTATRADRGWAPVTADMSLADCGDWPRSEFSAHIRASQTASPATAARSPPARTPARVCPPAGPRWTSTASRATVRPADTSS